jgi:hypothetical protein
MLQVRLHTHIDLGSTSCLARCMPLPAAGLCCTTLPTDSTTASDSTTATKCTQLPTSCPKGCRAAGALGGGCLLLLLLECLLLLLDLS